MRYFQLAVMGLVVVLGQPGGLWAEGSSALDQKALDCFYDAQCDKTGKEVPVIARETSRVLAKSDLSPASPLVKPQTRPESRRRSSLSSGNEASRSGILDRMAAGLDKGVGQGATIGFLGSSLPAVYLLNKAQEKTKNGAPLDGKFFAAMGIVALAVGFLFGIAAVVPAAVVGAFTGAAAELFKPGSTQKWNLGDRIEDRFRVKP